MLIKHIVKIIFLLNTMHIFYASDDFVVMEKPVTQNYRHSPILDGYTFSWYDHTNIIHIADQICPLWDDENLVYQAGEFEPTAPGFQIVFRDNSNNRVCAYAAFKITAQRNINLQQIAVHADHRRRGLATTFIQFIESYGSTLGSQHMSLAVRENNTAAQATYQSQGFK